MIICDPNRMQLAYAKVSRAASEGARSAGAGEEAGPCRRRKRKRRRRRRFVSSSHLRPSSPSPSVCWALGGLFAILQLVLMATNCFGCCSRSHALSKACGSSPSSASPPVPPIWDCQVVFQPLSFKGGVCFFLPVQEHQCARGRLWHQVPGLDGTVWCLPCRQWLCDKQDAMT